MKKKYRFGTILLFILALYGIPVSFFVMKDKDFSETENRYLSQKPAFSWENVVSGKYMQDVEKYINDQFPMRNTWISFKSDFLQNVGYREVNSVYLGDDDYLIEKWIDSDFDEKQLQKNIDAVNTFTQKHSEKKISVMLVPTAGMIYKDKLPPYASMFDQQVVSDAVKEQLSDAVYIDLIPLFLSHNTEDLYYKTDHHWTTKGAFLAYSEWCSGSGILTQESDFTESIVTTEFQGSLYSRVLGNHCAKDEIELYKRKNEIDYQVEYNFGNIHSNSVYAMEHLQKKDKYQMFLDGNHPEIAISTSQRNNKHLLVIKDSFANAFVPFMLNDYETIHIIDLRYYNGNIDNYILENGINECLILYNVKNFCEDKNISEIGK